jgi:hypothetical protein
MIQAWSRARALLVVLTVLAVVAVGLTRSGGQSVSDDGPLFDLGGNQGFEIPIYSEGSASATVAYLDNKSDKPITLLSAKPWGVSPGMKVLGLLVVNDTTGGYEGFPPVVEEDPSLTAEMRADPLYAEPVPDPEKDPRHAYRTYPVAGWTIGPANDLNDDPRIIVGFTVDPGGEGGLRGIDIEYKVGSKRYTLRTTWIVTACRPPEVTGCPDTPFLTEFWFDS